MTFPIFALKKGSAYKLPSIYVSSNTKVPLHLDFKKLLQWEEGSTKIGESRFLCNIKFQEGCPIMFEFLLLPPRSRRRRLQL